MDASSKKIQTHMRAHRHTHTHTCSRCARQCARMHHVTIIGEVGTVRRWGECVICRWKVILGGCSLPLEVCRVIVLLAPLGDARWGICTFTIWFYSFRIAFDVQAERSRYKLRVSILKITICNRDRQNEIVAKPCQIVTN